MLDTSEENDVVRLLSLPTARKALSDFLPVDCATASTAVAPPRANMIAAKSKAGLIGYNLQFTHFCPIGNFRLGPFTEIVDVGRWVLRVSCSFFSHVPRSSCPRYSPRMGPIREFAKALLRGCR